MEAEWCFEGSCHVGSCQHGFLHDVARKVSDSLCNGAKYKRSLQAETCYHKALSCRSLAYILT